MHGIFGGRDAAGGLAWGPWGSMRKRIRKDVAFREWGNDWRARRGDVKYLLLETLLEQPMHGYEIIRRLEEQHGGRYRPSPGSVYPTLQMLEEGGFLSSETIEGKRVYALTAAGRQLLEERRDSDEDADDDPEFAGRRDVRQAAWKLFAAVRQGLHHADPATRERIRKVVDGARREIYTILAADDV
jgi:DNA-binding PadR family transcriptional regulator